MKQMLIAANWKMNKTISETQSFLKELQGVFSTKPGRQLLICPSFLSLSAFQEAFGASDKIKYGAQNCHHQASGAFTGEVSVGMLKSLGCTYTLVGHSERRTLFKETDEDVAKKVKALQEGGVTPVACIGETEAERMQGKTLEVVERQLQAILTAHKAGTPLVIAYEPVWAIGTGKVPTTDEIDAVHKFMRSQTTAKLGAEGEKIPLLYGGSVNPQNSKEIESVGDVNGFLIGGASLKVASLMEIY